MSRKGENIYKRKDGRWEARYIKEHRINGRIHYGYCYGKTYHEARDKVNQARYALMNDQLLPVRGKRNRFADYCNEWLYLKRSSVKPSTFVKYTTILEKYIKPDLGQYFSEAVSEILVEQFSYRLVHERGLSPKTVRDILSVLHSILNYTTKQNPLAKPVDIVYPRQDRKEMRVLTCEEQKRFTEYLLQDMDPCKFGVLLALLTGLRIGEVCALKWEDISLENKVIFVRHTMQRLKNLNPASEERTRIITGVPKSGRSVRMIPMNQDIEKLCNKWRADDLEDDQEQYDQTKNDQAFNTFCSYHKISHIANGNYNFRNIISNLNGKSLSSGNGLICYCSGSLGGIEIGDRIFICLGIFLYKDRSTCADRRTLLRDRICNRSDWEVRCLLGFIHDHCSHPEERRKNKSQYTDQCAYHNKMYDKFQYF